MKHEIHFFINEDISNLFLVSQDTQHKLEYGQIAEQISKTLLTKALFSVVGKVLVKHYTITDGVVRGMCANIH